MIFLLKIFVFLGILALLVFKGFRIKRDSYDNFSGLMIDKSNFFPAFLALLVFSIIAPAVGTVEAGYRGVVLRFGAVTGEVLNEGIYMVVPLMESVEMMNVQVQAEVAKAEAASLDLQKVTTEVTLNYYFNPLKVARIYQNLRQEALPRIIRPAIQESVKAATAHYNAENLITQRHEVKDEIQRLLENRLEEHDIFVDEVNITDFDFTETFNQSIEAKVKATQDALRATNELERVKKEAEQQVTLARAQAEALRLQREQVTPQLIQLRTVEAQLRAVEKWNGILPQTFLSCGGGQSPVPIVDLFKKPAGN
jgi:regulator of protease activity HflC (stomatin/prohibitin superfamily)